MRPESRCGVVGANQSANKVELQFCSTLLNQCKLGTDTASTIPCTIGTPCHAIHVPAMVLQYIPDVDQEQQIHTDKR